MENQTQQVQPQPEQKKKWYKNPGWIIAFIIAIMAFWTIVNISLDLAQEKAQKAEKQKQAVIADQSAKDQERKAEQQKTQKAEATEKAEISDVSSDSLEVVFNASDFNKKSVESLRDKYKEFITLDDINELPMFSHLEFKKNNIGVTSQYLASEKMIQSVTFIFDDEKCNFKIPISKEETEKLLKMVGVSFNAEKWELRGKGIIKHLVAEDYEGWGKIDAMCGLSNIRSLSFRSYDCEGINNK